MIEGVIIGLDAGLTHRVFRRRSDKRELFLFFGSPPGGRHPALRLTFSIRKTATLLAIPNPIQVGTYPPVVSKM